MSTALLFRYQTKGRGHPQPHSIASLPRFGPLVEKSWLRASVRSMISPHFPHVLLKQTFFLDVLQDKYTG